MANPTATLETSLGNIEVELFVDKMPITAGNFVKLAKSGFYDGLHFHRVIEGFMAQGGDPTGSGTGGSSLPDLKAEFNAMPHVRGTVSMARLGPGTATAEFFICIGDQPELDFGGRRNPDGQGFAAFGQVVRGRDVVQRLYERGEPGQMLRTPIAVSRVRRLLPDEVKALSLP